MYLTSIYNHWFWVYEHNLVEYYAIFVPPKLSNQELKRIHTRIALLKYHCICLVYLTEQFTCFNLLEKYTRAWYCAGSCPKKRILAHMLKTMPQLEMYGIPLQITLTASGWKGIQKDNRGIVEFGSWELPVLATWTIWMWMLEICRSTDDTKIDGVDASVEDSHILQGDINMWVKWAKKWKGEFNCWRGRRGNSLTGCYLVWSVSVMRRDWKSQLFSIEKRNLRGNINL